MDEIKPRYEFRVWAESLVLVRKKLESLTQSRESASKETYLVSEATDRCNAKIRADLMDIKILVQEDRKLEQWKPVLKAGFPLERTVIITQVFPSLQLQPPLLSRTGYWLEEFLEIIQADPRIAVVEVSKVRHQFSVGACQAEFAFVTLANVVRDTVAVESTDPDAVLQLIQDLGIKGTPNTSYIREIKRILRLGGSISTAKSA
ncbi:hypothetical protein [Edaphobacter aggregans]|uniref:hypothetical protein n=1 Tax=Edaphobacter aggregans TaxID=570835 RepID=UPI0005588E4A|nr:hypothetical protein [Edaphobacter aggregans]